MEESIGGKRKGIKEIKKLYQELSDKEYCDDYTRGWLFALAWVLNIDIE